MPSTPGQPAPFQPIMRRLVRLTILVGLAATLLAALVEFGLGYFTADAAFHAEADEIADSQLPLLSIALWEIEPEALQAQIDRIAARRQILWVRLVSWEGRIYVAGEPIKDQHADVVMTIPTPRGNTPLGKLEFSYDRAYFYHDLAKQIVSTVIVLVVLTSIICLMLIKLLRRELQRPLERIADFNARLSPANLTEQLTIRRAPRAWRDEIDLLAESFDILRAGIKRYVIERDEATAKLAQQRDDLDRAVNARTADLIRLNAFLETLSQLSTRFIHLERDQYPSALRDALETITQQLDITACGLAERTATGAYRWRFIYRRKMASLPTFAEDEVLAALPWNEHAEWTAQYWDTVPDDPAVAQFMAGYAAQAMAAFRNRDGELGQLMLCVCASPHDWARSGLRQIEMAAEMMFTTLLRWHDLAALDETRRELWLLSRSDSLTRLPNRRHFDERKIEEARRALREGTPLGILMIDVDFFKRYNDGYGHGAGDECLIAVAETLRTTLHRVGDFLARLGGEEFVVLLPNTHIDQAQQIGERLQQAVFMMNLPHEHAPLGRVTVSIGASVIDIDPKHVATAEQRFDNALLRADDALYIAKAGGRNQVTSLRMTTSDRSNLDLDTDTPAL
ncbi:MAG: diguanylate cyclase [Burkholderiales bacterium]|nr:diguanylate cyclase [Burkholderiales bacterium]